jgi:prepilin-type N-terminal cleavage/methylation domain-containing protein
VVSGQCSAFRFPLSSCSPRGFTLVELLVTITIIGMLAAMMLGALHAAGNIGKEAATKATIAKLNGIIMQRWESYLTRRVPIQIPPGTTPTAAATMRLNAIRDLMRMEMPDHYSDIYWGPYVAGLPEPALHQLYRRRYGSNPPASRGANEPGKCLYLLVSMSNPEAMEQFNESEIGTDADGWSYFVDGWGSPIFFLRWAPGFSSNWAAMNLPYHGLTSLGTGYPTAGPSDIQSGDPVNDHDPFDTRNVDNGANGKPRDFRMVPLIYSTHGFQSKNVPCIFIGGPSYRYTGDPYKTYIDSGPSGTNLSLLLGTVVPQTSPPTPPGAMANVTNHHIEQR